MARHLQQEETIQSMHGLVHRFVYQIGFIVHPCNRLYKMCERSVYNPIDPGLSSP